MSQKATTRCLVLFSALGILNGFLIKQLISYKVLYITPYLLPSCWFLFFALAYDEKHTFRLFLTSFVSALITTLPVLYNNFHGPSFFDANKIIILFSLPFYAYVIHCFHHAIHLESRLNITYPTLYNSVWHTYIVLTLASIFAAIAYYIVYIPAWGFKFLGFDFLLSFLSMLSFTFYGFVLYFGLGITKQFEKLSNQLRLLILKMAFYLYPVVMVLTALFFVLFLFKNPLSSLVASSVKGYESLFVLVIIGIINFNAYFRDGFTQSNNVVLGLMSKCYRVILFLSALIVCIHSFAQFRMTINVEILLILMLLYTLAYALSVLLPLKMEITFIQRANIFISLFYILSIMIVNNPIYPLTPYHVLPSPFLLPPNTNQMVPKRNPVNISSEIDKIDKDLNSVGLSWIPQTAMISTIFNAALDNQPQQGICRVAYQGAYQIGRWTGSDCIISYAGKAFPVNNAQLLMGENQQVSWQPLFFNQKKTLPLAVEYINPQDRVEVRELQACRALYQNQLLIGKLVGFNCNIGVGNKEVSVNNVFQVLGKKGL